MITVQKIGSFVTYCHCDLHGDFLRETSEEDLCCPGCDEVAKTCPSCDIVVYPVTGWYKVTGGYDRCPNCYQDLDKVQESKWDFSNVYDEYSDLYLNELERMEG